MGPATISIVGHSSGNKHSECTAKCGAMSPSRNPYPTHPYTVANSLTHALRRDLLATYGKDIPLAFYHFNAERVGVTLDIKVGNTELINRDNAAFGWVASLSDRFSNNNFVTTGILIKG